MKYLKFLILGFGVAFSFNSFAQNGIDSSFGNKGIVKHVLTNTYPGSKFVPTRLQKDAENRLYAFGNDTINGISSYCVSRWLASGQLDSAFGNKGYLFFSTAGTGTCLPPLLQADGKFIYVGYQNINGKKTFVVTRFLPNSNLDSSFAINGQGIYAATYFNDVPVDIALQNDGKILILSDDLSNKDFLTMRITVDGRIDSTFNGTGLVKTNLIANETTRRVLVQTDGKILVAGNTFGSSNKLGLVRYLENGNLDSTFGTNGILVQSLTNGNDYFIDFCLANDGKITAYAITTNVPTLGALVQWNSNGSLFNSFGLTGVKNIGYTANQILIDSTGIIYVRVNSIVKRHLKNGDLDSSFGSSGSYDFTKHTGGTAQTMINSNGNGIRMLGSKPYLSVTDLILSAVDTSGSFGTNGYVKSSVGSTNSTEKYIFRGIASLSLPDGSLIIAGYTKFHSVVSLTIIKFLPNGNKDLNFGNNGVFEVLFSNTPTRIDCNLILGLDQNILIASVGTWGSSFNTNQLKLFKINQNGQLQNTFGTNGFVSDFDANFLPPLLINTQGNGKIILGWKGLIRLNFDGQTDSTFVSNLSKTNKSFDVLFVLRNDQLLIGTDTAVMRLDANGSFDPTFGKNGFSSLFNIHQCSGSPIKYYYKPNEIIYERIGNNLVVSYFVVNCGDYLLNNWTRITENGIALNSIYTQDSSFFYPNQVSLPNQFNLVGSVREQYYMHNLMLHMSFLTKVDVNGNIDHSFGDNGTLYGEKGIFYGGTFPVYYFESVEPISDTKLWYVRNANDTIYLSYILQPKPYGLIISANKQDIGFGDTVRFSAESYQPILNYHWRFAGASIRYLNGTDSSSANPMVQFIHSGRFDVTLQADLADTILTSTNKNYILLTPSIDFTKSKTLVYVNDSLNFQSVYKGYPNSFLWQISPNINPFIMGSDSSTRNSSIKIIEPGKYNVRLTLNYTDTTISLLKQDYFVASWPARLNSSVKVTKLNIYPNPTNTSFYIISDNIDEMLVCEIIDPQGRSIQTLQINPKEHSAISLPAQAGIYLIRLSNLDGKTWLAKVVKE